MMKAKISQNMDHLRPNSYSSKNWKRSKKNVPDCQWKFQFKWLIKGGHIDLSKEYKCQIGKGPIEGRVPIILHPAICILVNKFIFKPKNIGIIWRVWIRLGPNHLKRIHFGSKVTQLKKKTSPPKQNKQTNKQKTETNQEKQKPLSPSSAQTL